MIEQEASGITGLMMVGVLLIPWLTLAISEILLALYRRSVVSAMREQMSTRPPSISPATPSATTPGRVALVVRSADDDASGVSDGVTPAGMRSTIATSPCFCWALPCPPRDGSCLASSSQTSLPHLPAFSRRHLLSPLPAGSSPGCSRFSRSLRLPSGGSGSSGVEAPASNADHACWCCESSPWVAEAEGCRSIHRTLAAHRQRAAHCGSRSRIVNGGAARVSRLSPPAPR